MSLMALIMACFTACESNNNLFDIDYATEIVGAWEYSNDTIYDRFIFNADGTYKRDGVNYNSWEILIENGKWMIDDEELILMSLEGEEISRATIDILIPEIMTVMTNKATKNTTSYLYVEIDYPSELVGTWTCLEEGYAEALIIAKDGSLVATGVAGDKYWEGKKGQISRYNETYSYFFVDADSVYSFGDCQVILGEMIQFVDWEGNNHIYKYCPKDLSEEIIGMWICNSTAGGVNDMSIQTFSEDGQLSYTGFSPMEEEFIMTSKINYEIIGDLKFLYFSINGVKGYSTSRINITPNAITLGDIMTNYTHRAGATKPTQTSFIRVKQNLDLLGNKYNYSSTYITNAIGEDKDIPFLNGTFNLAKTDDSVIDKFLKSNLFTIKFDSADTITYSYVQDGKTVESSMPILVEGNKMTLLASQVQPFFRDVELYTFQDTNNNQFHMYLHTTAFENFFANTSVSTMLGKGELDVNDTNAIDNIYKNIADAVESINFSIVMKAPKAISRK